MEALAQKVVDGEIPPDQIRKVIGVDKKGNPIYSPSPQQEEPYFTFQGPFRGKHRQPLRSRG